MVGISAFSGISQPMISSTYKSTDIQKVNSAEDKSDVRVDKKSVSDKSDKKSFLENVVAETEYGDTLQVSDKGRELDQSSKIAETDDSNQGVEVAQTVASDSESDSAAASDDKAYVANFDIAHDTIAISQESEYIEADSDEKIEIDMGPMFDDEDDSAEVNATSMAAYSKSELNQMYLKGEISQYKYETEIERRSEAAKNAMKEIKTSSEDLGKTARVAANTARDEIEFKNIFSDDSSDKISGKNRLEAIDGLNKAIDNQFKADTKTDDQSFKFVIGEIA